MKKLLLPLISLLTIGLLAAIPHDNSLQQVAATEELSISSTGDAFTLLDKQYSIDDSFVYTADLHFKSGQAGGLAFGAEENDHYFVINMDRHENHVKLLYFKQGEGGFVDELYSCDFLGHNKLMQCEWDKINPKVREIENVNIKLVLTREDEHAYVEFFVEGIKRFGIDTTIDLNNLGKSYTYQGGYLGLNCFSADVYLENIEIGKSDYSYFSEPYRNQFHLQPFSKWTNDPNALCYFNGWYHVFYQTNPFGLGWSDMFWGHARSKDLIHFEFLPVCLFPEVSGRYPFGDRDAYMWSGCAIAYYHGMSALVDSKGWFTNGGGDGLLAIYTRDGAMQDQEVIYSDDEGLTWVKTGLIISQTMISPNGQDWRDPKVFPLTKDGSGKVTTWGMTLSGYRSSSKGYFLKSTDLINWNLAGNFYLPDPECIGVGFLEDNLSQTHAYLTNKSRTYILGTIEYDGGDIIFKDETNTDISTYSLEQITAKLKPLDFGPDTYASQSFYITDPASEYCGKEIVMNWFSGDLNASFCTGPGEYAGLRKRWNGGFTIPVEYGVVKTKDEYRITQKPITINNINLEKTEVVNLADVEIDNNTDNLLKDVHTHVFELEASITINENSPITFKVDIGDGEYMQFGWNEIDGYYVDRTYLDDKGINTNIDWHVKYASHILGDSDVKTFYVLSDNGGLEVFCENYSISFYFVTTASIYSTGASLKVSDGYANYLRLNEVKSVFRKEVAPGEGVLHVASNDVSLDSKFATSKFVTCWYSGNEDLEWEMLEGEDVVSYITSNQGINLTALKEGTAQFRVSAGNQSQLINVTVYLSTFISDLSFDKDNVVSGQWIMQDDAIIGEKTSGNGFLLADETGSDFTYSAQFDIISGTAGALVFRAALDMSSYLVANYDTNEHVAKLWSTHGELARSGDLGIDASNTITLSVRANEKDVQVFVNGVTAITYTLHDDEPLSGHFGLNVFSGTVKFKTLSILKENFEYSSGDLAIALSVDQFITNVYNITLGNVRLEPGFYYQNNGTLYIRASYFALLPGNGRYQFRIVGSSLSFNVNVDVNIIPSMTFEDLNVEHGNDVIVYVGTTPISSVAINDETIAESQYFVKDYQLHINHECFKEGENDVVLNGSISFKVNVKNMEDEVVTKTETEVTTKQNSGPFWWLFAAGGAIAALGGLAIGGGLTVAALIGIIALAILGLLVIAGVVVLIVVLTKRRKKYGRHN